jgi:hypothetical protein
VFPDIVIKSEGVNIDADRGQIEDIVTAWLEKNPGERHYAADKLVGQAISETWSCKKESIRPLFGQSWRTDMSLEALKNLEARVQDKVPADSPALKDLREQIRLEERRQNQSAKEVWMSGPNVNEGPQEE